MKEAWKWIVGVFAAGAAAVAAYFMLRKPEEAEDKHEPASQPESSFKPAAVSKDVDLGLGKLQAVADTYSMDGKEFVSTFFSYLRAERDSLSDADKARLDQNPEETKENLKSFEAVQALARKWAEKQPNSPPSLEYVMLNPSASELSDSQYQGLLTSSVFNVRQRNEEIKEAINMTGEFRLPWLKEIGAHPLEELAQNIDSKYEDGRSLPVIPSGFPLIIRQESAFADRIASELLTPLKQAFPKDQFPSIYDANEQIVLNRGIDRPTLQRMHSAIEDERQRMLDGIKEAVSDKQAIEKRFLLNPEFLSPEGQKEAEKIFNHRYDAVTKFIDAFQEQDAVPVPFRSRETRPETPASRIPFMSPANSTGQGAAAGGGR